MGLGGYLAARPDTEHYAAQEQCEHHKIDHLRDLEIDQVEQSLTREAYCVMEPQVIRPGLCSSASSGYRRPPICEKLFGESPMIIQTKSLILTVVALGFVLGPPALAAGPHAYDGPTATIQLQLDHGKKWSTDDVLRRGMSEIRVAMMQSLTSIHNNVLTPAQYEAMAARIQTQIDYVVGNCKLPEQADQQLHHILEQIINGAADMKTGADRKQGAMRIVQALARYGEYFDHAGWQPLEH